MDDQIFIFKQPTKSIKIIYEELPCPIMLNHDENFRCKYAKSKVEDMNFIIYCSADKCTKLGYVEIE